MYGSRRYNAVAAALLFPVFLACAALPARAQIGGDRPQDFVTSLTEENIHAFITEVGAISTGQRLDMLDEDIVNYFHNHMTEHAKLQSLMHYEIPNFPPQDNELNLKRDDYIATIINGRYLMENYEAEIEIRDLDISGNGKQATFTSMVREKGLMPFPTDPEKPNGELENIPIQGESVCQQKLIVSYNNFIQMAQADCKTNISFDPFGGKPLVP